MFELIILSEKNDETKINRLYLWLKMKGMIILMIIDQLTSNYYNFIDSFCFVHTLYIRYFIFAKSFNTLVHEEKERKVLTQTIFQLKHRLHANPGRTDYLLTF